MNIKRSRRVQRTDAAFNGCFSITLKANTLGVRWLRICGQQSNRMSSESSTVY